MISSSKSSYTHNTRIDPPVEGLLVDRADPVLEFRHEGLVREPHQVGAHVLLQPGADMRVREAGQKTKKMVVDVHFSYESGAYIME